MILFKGNATAARIGASESKGTVFAPMAMVGAGGPPADRLVRWLAPMAEGLTGSSRAAVQRNLAWMEARGLIREVTGQGRYRMWRALIS
jgi:hypothetical protein